MDWNTMLAYVTGSVDENVLLRDRAHCASSIS